MNAEKLANYAPSCFKFSPDNTFLTYLHASSHHMKRQLWGVNLDTLVAEQVVMPSNDIGDGDTEENMSFEEKLRRERQRTFVVGVTTYDWSSRQSKLSRVLIPLQGSLYVQDSVGVGVGVRCVYDSKSGGGAAIDPQLSPNGRMIGFVRKGELYIISADEIIAAAPGPAPLGSQPNAGHGNSLHTNIGDSTKNGGIGAGNLPVQVTFGAAAAGKTHGLADFVAQEEMDRYTGFWWSDDSSMIAFAEVDESHIPVYTIPHQGKEDLSEGHIQEEHRYPFAGQPNAKTRLGVIPVDIARPDFHTAANFNPVWINLSDCFGNQQQLQTPQLLSGKPGSVSASEYEFYLARVNWLPDGSLSCQVENRDQTKLRLLKCDPLSGSWEVMLEEESDLWINLHQLLHFLDKPVAPANYGANSGPATHSPLLLPPGSFSFLWGSERTSFMHLYLYTYIPGTGTVNIGAVTSGDYIVEQINGYDLERNLCFFSGTYDTPLECHLYVCPLIPVAPANANNNTSYYNSYSNNFSVSHGSNNHYNNHHNPNHYNHQSGHSNPDSGRHRLPLPIRLTTADGMHSVKMDFTNRRFIDVFSSPEMPSKTMLFSLPDGLDFSKQTTTSHYNYWGGESSHNNSNNTNIGGGDRGRDRDRELEPILLCELHDAMDGKLAAVREKLVIPEIFSFRPRDGAVELYGALYRPNAAVHGPGPYPTVVSVYGGPHVQKVNRSWSLTVDMMAQRLRDLGFAVLKCDNRGSSRRGLHFEGVVKRNFGEIEVNDQEDAVKYVASKGIADISRGVGIYGWSYGGYLSSMCLCKAQRTFRVAVAGAPVTSWDGYDTHYTERYMSTPQSNPVGYQNSSILSHVNKMNGKLMLAHGQIDENVHFRHTARLINALIEARKPYELVLFPDGRHSLRKQKDRIYLEERITDFFAQHLLKILNNQQTLVNAHL